MIYDRKTCKIYVKDSSGELKELGNLDCYEVESCAYDEAPTATLTVKVDPGNFRICEDVFKDLNKTEYCVVKDRGLCYCMYREWVERNFYDYKDDFIFKHDEEDIKPDRIYRIVGHAPHLDHKKTELYLIQDMDTEQVFIIEKEGIDITTRVTAPFIKTQKTQYCDDLHEIIDRRIENKKGEERNMNNKILDLYYERRKESIIEDFKAMLEEEYNSNPAVKEYNELVGTFEASLAEVANRYNTDEETILVKSGYHASYVYELNESIKTKLRGDLKASFDAEMKDLELLVEEVRAMLAFSDNDEHRMNVLKQYEIVDKKGKLNI